MKLQWNHWALIQEDWCLYKGKFGCTQRRMLSEDKSRRGDASTSLNAKIASQPSETRRGGRGNRVFPRPAEKPALPTSRSDTASELQNCYRMRFCVLAAHFVVFAMAALETNTGELASPRCVCGGHLEIWCLK